MGPGASIGLVGPLPGGLIVTNISQSVGAALELDLGLQLALELELEQQ